jgi:HD-GYP domain-containing protein (c-di-GMP phosphodiesterase class II)
VADTFDAMTSDRSYRKALSDEVAIKELIDYKGTQFDPQMVDAFLNLVKKYPDSIRNHIDELSKGVGQGGLNVPSTKA